MRRIITSALASLAALALVFVGALPANADHDGVHAVESWLVLDTNFKEGAPGWTPDAPQTPATHSKILDANTVELTQGDAVGTSLETSNLGVAGTNIEVDFELSDDASASAGAVRLFVYFDDGTSSPSNRPADAPAGLAIADAEATSGTLSITTSGEDTIGYAGLVYDGGADGSVTFSNLTIDGEAVSFIDATPPTSATPDEPTHVNETCDKLGSLAIPDVEGVSYTIENDEYEISESEINAGTHHVLRGTYVIRAHADEGFELNGDSEWTITVESECKSEKIIKKIIIIKDGEVIIEDDDDETPAPVPTEIPAGSGDELPKTGAGTGLLAGLAASLIGAGGLLTFAARRTGWLRS